MPKSHCRFSFFTIKQKRPRLGNQHGFIWVRDKIKNFLSNKEAKDNRLAYLSFRPLRSAVFFGLSPSKFKKIYSYRIIPNQSCYSYPIYIFWVISLLAILLLSIHLPTFLHPLLYNLFSAKRLGWLVSRSVDLLSPIRRRGLVHIEFILIPAQDMVLSLHRDDETFFAMVRNSQSIVNVEKLTEPFIDAVNSEVPEASRGTRGLFNQTSEACLAACSMLIQQRKQRYLDSSWQMSTWLKTEIAP